MGVCPTAFEAADKEAIKDKLDKLNGYIRLQSIIGLLDFFVKIFEKNSIFLLTWNAFNRLE
ncbi:hypothetical protein STRDD11_01503 [Streptococcus sp. DD11]|nr:hypothetical protein STRDD11_01503 [Streptococcus sp. DD11]